MTSFLSKRVPGVLACAFVLLSCGGAWAAMGLTVAGDSQNLWIIRPNTPPAGGFTVLHRRVADVPESRLLTARALTGTLLPGGAVAGDGYLWLFYADHTVQTLRFVEDSMGRRGFDPLIVASLPKSVTVRSLAVTRAGAWALVRIEDARVLDGIDNPKEPPEPWRERKKHRPPPEPQSPDPRAPEPEKTPEKPATKDAAAKDGGAKDGAKDAPAPPAPPKETAVKADRLLHLSGDGWVKIDLPDDWHPDTPAWLVTLSQDQPRPLLVTGPPSEKLIRWYQWERPATAEKDAPLKWVATQQALEEPVRMAPMAVRQQLVAVHRRNVPGRIELAFVIVRPQQLSDMGALALPETGGPWALTSYGDHIALIAADKDGAMAMNRIDLRGQTDANPVPLAVEPQSLGPIADLLVFIIVLAVATPVLILMWRRDSGPVLAQLPRTLRIADIGPRGIAAFIDLAPGMFIAMAVTGASFEEVLTFWPGRSGGWETMIPGAIVIGVFIAHTFLGELFTARSAGKALIGLRVTGLRGQPPDLWQVLARNIFKALDLIAMPLLIFAIISPNRQRLGDVVARTLVVRRATADDEAQGGPGGPGSQRRAEQAEREEESDEREEVPDPRPRRKE